jgi:hypothetical protein
MADDADLFRCKATNADGTTTTSAATLTLPAGANGMSLTVTTRGAVAGSVKAGASDFIYLDGVALDDGDKIFRDSLIENVREICGLIPQMILSPDPELLRAVDRATLEIAGFDPEDLRNDTDKRAKAKAAADAILKTMGGSFNPNQVAA